jgi:hypothetical protein
MKNLSIVALVALLSSGCIPDSPNLRDSQVINDFRRVVAKEHPYIQVIEVIGVEYGDGWDTGVETSVNFTGRCKSSHQKNIEICSSNNLKLSLSYSLDESLKWRVIGNKLNAVTRAKK